MNKNIIKITLIAIVLLSGCASVEPYNYDALKQEAPRSILVLPPMNSSEYYTSTQRQSLSER